MGEETESECQWHTASPGVVLCCLGVVQARIKKTKREGGRTGRERERESEEKSGGRDRRDF